VTTAWPLNRAPDGPAIWETPGALAEPIAPPVGRGLWRFALHERQFSDQNFRDTLITEIVGARGIRLEMAWNRPAKLTLTLDGHHPTTALIRELQTDIYAWRWDEWAGADRCMFRGIVSQSLDQLTEQAYTVNFVCHDYLKMLERRLLTNSLYAEQVDQDSLVLTFVDRAKRATSSSGISFSPGSYLPVEAVLLAPDGSPRGSSGILRDRNYPASSNVAELLDNLANCIGGFDYDLIPGPAAPGVTPYDQLRIFYPYKGVVRDNPLVYGVTVSGLTRSANAANYANYWRTLGHNADDPEAEQLWAEDWNEDVNDVNRLAVGTWMAGDNAADVSEVDTLQEKATGNLSTYGQFIPSFTLTLRPGGYRWDTVQIGDVLPLVVQEGRMNLQAQVRLLALSFAIGSDGNEDVEVDVGRPTANLFQLLTRADKDVDALTRRDSGPTGPDAPVGSMFYWPGVTPPNTWAWADGRALSRTTYPELFDVIGYTFGGAADLFNVPDCRGRGIIGVGQGDGLTNRARGATGGAEAHVLTVGQLAAHGHGVAPHSHGGPDHSHSLQGHTHGDAAHNHSLNNHAHAADQHTHTMASHTHSGQTAGFSADHSHAYRTNATETNAQPGTTQGIMVNPVNASSGLASSNHSHAFATGAPNPNATSGIAGAGNTGGNNGATGGSSGGSTAGPAPNATGNAGTGNTGGPSAGTSASTGNSEAHENMAPFIAIGQMIRISPPVYRTTRRRVSA
jgi:microcystin-dependent protein